MNLKKLKSSLKWRLRHSFAFMILEAVAQHQAILFCLFIGPMLFFCLVYWLQANFFPWGAILFWAVYIPLICGAAAIDYTRKRKGIR
jgi:hypothetical protein